MNNPNLKRIFSYSRKHWQMLSLSVISATMLGLVAAIPTYLIKHTIDDVFIKQLHGLIVPFAIVFVLFFALKGFFMVATAYTMHWVGNRVVNQIRYDLLSRLLHYPLSFFQRITTGQLIAHFLNDVQMIQNAASTAIKNGIRSFFEALFLISYAFVQNWRLACLLLIVGPLMAYVISSMGKRIKRASTRIQQEVGNVSRMLQELFVGIREVKSFNAEEYELSRFRLQLDRCFKTTMKFITIEALLPALIEVVAMLGAAVAFYVAVHQIINGSTTPGELTAFIAATLLAYQPLKRVINVYGELQAAVAAADRIFGLMDIQFPQTPQLVDKQKFEREIVLNHVHFSYTNDTPVLHDLSLHIKRGERIGIVGPSGSGKSTLCDLLMGFIAPISGSVTIDGIPLNNISLAQLRALIGYVGQRTFLFNDTLLHNIAYGTENADHTALQRALHDSHCDEFLDQLPGGINAVVGEQGNLLSGGQKQRATIARALYKNPPILIFDEATSSLDFEAEEVIKQTIAELPADKTVIIITHRPSLLAAVDRVLQIEEGKIKEKLSNSIFNYTAM